MRHASFPGRAFLRAFTNSTACALGLGASIDLARNSYSREIDMQARWKTRRTASAGVGIGVGFMGEQVAVVQGSHFSPVELLNATQLI